MKAKGAGARGAKPSPASVKKGPGERGRPAEIRLGGPALQQIPEPVGVQGRRGQRRYVHAVQPEQGVQGQHPAVDGAGG